MAAFASLRILHHVRRFVPRRLASSSGMVRKQQAHAARRELPRPAKRLHVRITFATGEASEWRRGSRTYHAPQSHPNSLWPFRRPAAPVHGRSRALDYQIARLPVDGKVGGPETRYFHHRSSVRGGPVLADGSRLDETSYHRSTFTTGYDIVANNEYNNPAGQHDADPLEPGRIRQPIVSQVIASDVIDFGIRVYCEEPGRRAVERFPADRRMETGPTPLPPTPVWAFLATSSTSATPINPATGPVGLAAAPKEPSPLRLR